MTISDDAAWNAVLRRDRTSDGRFVFAVTSTGIYCRPSCPARRPNRTNVSFYEKPDDAAAAGYRACKRCRPDDDAASLAERARVILDERIEDGATLAELANELGASPAHLQRTFRRRFGASPKEYLAAKRAERLRQELKNGMPVTDATYEAGYGSSSRVYSQSDARLGMTPGTYRHGGRGMQIRFVTVPISLGRLLVATTDRGVCAVSIGDDDAALERELRSEFAQASISRTDADDVVRRVVDEVERGTTTGELPLDIEATAFQIRVWTALRKIPRGETRTYAEVAALVGQPTAARAVANACAKNRVAVVIPCHRVVRGDGDAGGYRWGAARKKEILARERG